MILLFLSPIFRGRGKLWFTLIAHVLIMEGSVLVFDTFGLFSLLAAEPDQIGYVGPCADAEVFYDPFQ